MSVHGHTLWIKKHQETHRKFVIQKPNKKKPRSYNHRKNPPLKKHPFKRGRSGRSNFNFNHHYPNSKTEFRKFRSNQNMLYLQKNCLREFRSPSKNEPESFNKLSPMPKQIPKSRNYHLKWSILKQLNQNHFPGNLMLN
jgi:hypothetical protein